MFITQLTTKRKIVYLLSVSTYSLFIYNVHHCPDKPIIEVCSLKLARCDSFFGVCRDNTKYSSICLQVKIYELKLLVKNKCVF